MLPRMRNMLALFAASLLPALAGCATSGPPLDRIPPFVNPDAENLEETVEELTRATPEEKKAQLDNLRAFQKEHAPESGAALARLQKVALTGDNIFTELMRAVRVASLGQITRTLYQVGGQYRRSM